MKKPRYILSRVCFALSVGCLTAGVPAGENLVKNPSFEIDADGDGVPDGWTHGAGHYGRWQEKVKKQLAANGGEDASIEGEAGQGNTYEDTIDKLREAYKSASGGSDQQQRHHSTQL